VRSFDASGFQVTFLLLVSLSFPILLLYLVSLPWDFISFVKPSLYVGARKPKPLSSAPQIIGIVIGAQLYKLLFLLSKYGNLL